MMRSSQILIAFAIAAGFICGCGSRPRDSDYTTIRADPRRDTELARRENARAIQLIEKGKWEQAEAALRKALDADVTFGPAHNNLGRVFYQQRRFYHAAWEFQYAMKLMPYSPEPKNNLGLVLEETGKLDEAVKHYDEALAIEPENPQLIGNAARVRIRRGDRDDRTRELLTLLISTDERSEWVVWGKEQLVMMRPPAPATQGKSLP